MIVLRVVDPNSGIFIERQCNDPEKITLDMKEAVGELTSKVARETGKHPTEILFQEKAFVIEASWMTSLH